MISNHATTQEDLDNFEKHLLEANYPITNWDETNHLMNELVKNLHILSKGDKYREHYVRIKKIVKQVKDLDLEVQKFSQVGMEKGFHLFENFLYDRPEVLEHIETNVNLEISKHVNFVVGEVVHGHTVEKNVFDSVRQYSDLASLPEDELNAVVFGSYIQKVADEALQHDYEHGSFELFKSTIIAKIQSLIEIHFASGDDGALFKDYLEQITDRRWDTIIKTALL